MSRGNSIWRYEQVPVENIIDRLELLMDAYRLNNNSLTVRADLSVGLVGRARKERKGLHSDTILKILNVMPEVNVEWFIMGKGTPMKSGIPLKLFAADSLRRSLASSQRFKEQVDGVIEAAAERLAKAAEPAVPYGKSPDERLDALEQRVAALEKKCPS